MQSYLREDGNRGLHVAIIMDGNGRWASARGLPRRLGHRAGVAAVRRTVEAAPDLGVSMLTLYAFSADNWRRPAEEIEALMGLLVRYLRRDTARLAESGVRLDVIGRRDRLPFGLAALIARAEAASAAGSRLNLRVAIDYSARDAILTAAARARTPEDFTRQGFARLIAGDPRGRDVDLLIRTSGEQRLSDFLLWEAAYAELAFTPRLWPDFGPPDLESAIADFRTRDRRFGALGPTPARQAFPLEAAE